MFNLTTPEFSKKERVLILLKEYDSYERKSSGGQAAAIDSLRSRGR